MNCIEKKEYEKLKLENHDLKEQLKYFIPRRRVRRIYKLIKDILEKDGEELLDSNFISKDKIELLLLERLDKYTEADDGEYKQEYLTRGELELVDRYKECNEIFELLLHKKYKYDRENKMYIKS